MTVFHGKYQRASMYFDIVWNPRAFRGSFRYHRTQDRMIRQYSIDALSDHLLQAFRCSFDVRFDFLQRTVHHRLHLVPLVEIVPIDKKQPMNVWYYDSNTACRGGGGRNTVVADNEFVDKIQTISMRILAEYRHRMTLSLPRFGNVSSVDIGA